MARRPQAPRNLAPAEQMIWRAFQEAIPPVDTIRQALTFGADPNLVFTCPHYCYKPPQQSLVHHLMSRVSHIQQRASYDTLLDLFQSLHALGATFDGTGGEGNTLWHQWVAATPKNMARECPGLHGLLLSTGVDVHASNQHHVTALEIALAIGHWDKAAVLCEAGAALVDTPTARRSALTWVLAGAAKTAMDPFADDAAEVLMWLDWCLQQCDGELHLLDANGASVAETALGAPQAVIERLHAAGVDWDAPLSSHAWNRHAPLWEDCELQNRVKAGITTARDWLEAWARAHECDEELALFHALKIQQALMRQDALETTLTEDARPTPERRKPRL